MVKGHVSISIPPRLAFMFSVQIFKFIEAECENERFWWCLSFLMMRDVNLNVEEYLVQLQNSPILTNLLIILAKNIPNASKNQIPVYLEFLQCIIVESYERQLIIFDQEGQHVLKAFAKFYQTTRFIEHEYVVPLRSSYLLIYLSALYHERVEQNDQRSMLWFLNIGDLSILSDLFLIVVSKKNIKDVLSCISIVFNSFIKFNTTGLDRELYCIDRNSAYRMNVAFYKLFTEHSGNEVNLIMSMLMSYIQYIDCYQQVSVIESFLQYKPLGKDANSTLVMVAIKCIRTSDSTTFESDFMKYFTQWSFKFPVFVALLDEPLRELPPDRNDKVRVCALPGCNADGKGLFNKMKKCGRWRKTYYCCEVHQKEHWKVHKQNCGSTAAATTAILDEPLRELPPDRDDKVRVCALPRCGVNGEGLLRCSRCRSVYYCGVEHQKQHWKVHKQCCC